MTRNVLLVAIFLGAAALPVSAEPVTVQARFRADREALASLDAEVWRPMMTAYAAADLEGYLAVFAPDAVLARGDLPTLSPLAESRAGEARRFLLRRSQAGGFSREYRFTERAAYRDWSSERGFVAVTDPNGTIYEEFHYFCRKIEGRWRITTAYRKRLPPGAAENFKLAAAPGDWESF